MTTPVARLAPSVTLSLRETGTLLEALDHARQHVPARSPGGGEIRRAIALLTEKLWPELGELLEEEE